jgi:hypothetical protein
MMSFRTSETEYPSCGVDSGTTVESQRCQSHTAIKVNRSGNYATISHSYLGIDELFVSNK